MSYHPHAAASGSVSSRARLPRPPPAPALPDCWALSAPAPAPAPADLRARLFGFKRTPSRSHRASASATRASSASALRSRLVCTSLPNIAVSALRRSTAVWWCCLPFVFRDGSGAERGPPALEGRPRPSAAHEASVPFVVAVLLHLGRARSNALAVREQQRLPKSLEHDCVVLGLLPLRTAGDLKAHTLHRLHQAKGPV